MSNAQWSRLQCSLVTLASGLLGVFVGLSSMSPFSGNNSVVSAAASNSILSAADLEVLLGKSPAIRKIQADIADIADRTRVQTVTTRTEQTPASAGCPTTQERPSCLEICTLGSKGQYSYVNMLKNDCGQLCKFPRRSSRSAYSLDGFPIDVSYLYFNCPALFENDYMDCGHGQESPPRTIPKELRGDYLPSDQIQLTSFYIQQFYHTNKDVMKLNDRRWTRELVEDTLEKLEKGILKGSYDANQTTWLYEIMKTVEEVKAGTVLVVGSERPWVECILLAAGAKKVVTLEYGPIFSEHPQLETMLPNEFRARYVAGTLPLFDAVVSFSSIEHSGLGRYGDALNPYGDVMQVARSWCVTRDGGALVLGLPSSGHDYLRWNADRVYGPYRWSRITPNWRPVRFKVFSMGIAEFSKLRGGRGKGDPWRHAVYYGRKVSPAEAETMIRQTSGSSKCADTLNSTHFYSPSSSVAERRHCFN